MYLLRYSTQSLGSRHTRYNISYNRPVTSLTVIFNHLRQIDTLSMVVTVKIVWIPKFNAIMLYQKIVGKILLEKNVFMASSVHLGLVLFTVIITITKTHLYSFDPLKPHFYIVKLGFTGVHIIFLISAQKHRLWVLIRTASSRRF